MAKLSDRDSNDFNGYHHTYFIKMTDLQKGRNLEFIGEYFDSGKRYEQNQPGVTGQVLDKTYYDSRSIFHYFCNRVGAITGVSGGMMYRYNGVYLYIGFSNPLVGCKKSFVELKQKKETAKWANEQIEDSENKKSSCCGWKVEAIFQPTENPELKVTIDKDNRCT